MGHLRTKNDAVILYVPPEAFLRDPALPRVTRSKAPECAIEFRSFSKTVASREPDVLSSFRRAYRFEREW